MLKTRFPSLYASTSLDIKALTVVILKLSVDSLSCFSAKLIIFPNFSSVILSSENLPGMMLLLVGEGADV